MGNDGKQSGQGHVIDDNLKRVYQDMLDERVPDRFLDLLAQLKEQDTGKSGNGAK
ncbi:NepR family anti-sigma factor [Thalassococcus sp. BH17M4-6]|uniref:NepR family anti-sigma factor n=1 Tax=Thalassococcus sp. BH17M4-6 TaxID=3413148 RepID=UPI003BCFB8AE